MTIVNYLDQCSSQCFSQFLIYVFRLLLFFPSKTEIFSFNFEQPFSGGILDHYVSTGVDGLNSDVRNVKYDADCVVDTMLSFFFLF